MRRHFLSRFLLALLCLASSAGAAIDFGWPTPLPVLRDNLGPQSFLQATASGEWESGGYGCVRSGGHRFHEGIDIRPASRDRHGEPADDVFAAMDGIVRHVNALAGESNYGRYIVIEHPEQTPAVYTLYAHLSKIAPGITPGTRVTKGQILAVMGHTSNGRIPRDLAHLHFEIGLVETLQFQGWYNFKKFGSPNVHANYNGMNLLGVDPWDFISRWKRGEIQNFSDYFRSLPVAAKLRIASTRVPDFIQRYPSLKDGGADANLVAGWEIWVSTSGLPFRWIPLTSMQVAGLKPGQAVVTEANDELLSHDRCREIVKTKHGQRVPGKDLEEVIELVFGLR